MKIDLQVIKKLHKYGWCDDNFIKIVMTYELHGETFNNALECWKSIYLVPSGTAHSVMS